MYLLRSEARLSILYERGCPVQKTLMIVGAGILQVPAIKKAREMGLLSLVTDYNPEAYGMRLADFPVVMSTRDVDGTVRVARDFAGKRPIHGVLTVGTDASLTVAAVQQALGLPGNRVDVAEATTNKIRMRTRLREGGIPQPAFFSCVSYDDVVEAARQLGYPFVIKPSDNMGARGVMRVDRYEDIRFAHGRAKASSPRGEIIVEGFMDGPELSIDALVWREEIHITGVADRIIEFPPYFVETGHIMPTNLDRKLVEEGVSVFERGIRALGIEIGAAKGDIKLTESGAMVGEIASRLSGGFMSAYTYPYATGVDLIGAAIRVALGESPGDLTEKHRKVSVERAVIPGSGTVTAIEGVGDALSVEGVRNVFVTCGIGETVHVPTSNVEKCGNVIAVGDTREEALGRANEGVQRVRIRLGHEGELNEGIIRREAVAKLTGACAVCRVCDGIECAGRLPGIGSVGTGRGFTRNLRFLEGRDIEPRLLSPLDNVNTGSTLFGTPLDLPVLPAPISGMKSNLRSVFGEAEYDTLLLKGAKRAGTLGCVAPDEHGTVDEESALFDALEEVSGFGIPFFSPYEGRMTVLDQLHHASRAGVALAGISIDLRAPASGSLPAIMAREGWLEGLIGDSPLPLLVKGVLTPADAAAVMNAGAKGVVLSNRGGRILESMPGGPEMLEGVRAALGPDPLILVDGGIRTGEDVFKVLKLGADLALVGRPVFIAAAGGGEEGIVFHLNRIKRELRSAMLAAGTKTIRDIRSR
jgi:biotin carboxylase